MALDGFDERFILMYVSFIVLNVSTSTNKEETVGKEKVVQVGDLHRNKVKLS